MSVTADLVTQALLQNKCSRSPGVSDTLLLVMAFVMRLICSMHVCGQCTLFKKGGGWSVRLF